MVKCGYCGRENQDETQPCPGCGTLPPASADDVQREPGRQAPVGGLLSCSPHRLLEHAAALESVDMRMAIALYKLIALDHPGTRAAEEANRNAQTLTAAHPELEDFLTGSTKSVLGCTKTQAQRPCEFNAVTVTLKVDDDLKLYILLAEDGTVNRAGDGSLTNQDYDMYIGLEREPLFRQRFRKVVWIG